MANPFPTPYPTLLRADPLMEAALLAALAEVALTAPGTAGPSRGALSVAAVNGSPGSLDLPHAGLRYGETHYSASVLKVAAMYAAFELLSSANRIAPSSADAGALFAGLHANFDDPIDAGAPTIAASGLTRQERLPTYERVLKPRPLASGGMLCLFQDTFLANLQRMIINSDNAAAAACIRALGFSWINGALKAGGFFFPPSSSGVWLAGTFAGGLTPVRIPSANDGPVAQATTTFDLANLVAHVLNGTLVNQVSSDQMLTMLGFSASEGPDPSWMDFTRRAGFPVRGFGVTATKVGIGPLKTGRSVASEATVVEHGDTGRRFVVVWQNSFDDHASLFAMGQVIERTIDLFLFGG